MDIATETYTYKVIDECEVKADVYRAAGEGPRPVVVWIHGGALIMGAREGATGRAMRYVAAGYTVVSIDYRLAPETKAAGIVEDLCDAIRWVREDGPARFGIDSERLAVVGHSAGGYLTLMSGWCVDPPPTALVAFYGYGDVVGQWYSRPSPFYCQQPVVSREQAYAAVGGPVIATSTGTDNRHRFYLYCRQQGIWPQEVVGHDPDTEPDAFTAFCPVRNVSSDYPPTLLLHGDRDTDVPHELSVMMARELGGAGVEHELITIAGGEHGFDAAPEGRPQVERALERVIQFLGQHLG